MDYGYLVDVMDMETLFVIGHICGDNPHVVLHYAALHNSLRKLAF